MKYPDQNRRKPRVDLVAGDNALRSSIRMLLSVSGMEVHEYRTARAYLTARPAPPGCLVADWRPADMPGRRFCVELNELSRRIPVVVLTSSPEEFELAGSGYPNIRIIRKPFASQILVNAIVESAAESVDEHQDRAPLDASPAAP